MAEEFQVLSIDDFTAVTIQDETFQREVIKDLGNVELEPGMSVRGLIGTLINMTGKDREESVQILKSKMQTIYGAYLKLCVDNNYLTEEQADNIKLQNAQKEGEGLRPTDPPPEPPPSIFRDDTDQDEDDDIPLAEDEEIEEDLSQNPEITEEENREPEEDPVDTGKIKGFGYPDGSTKDYVLRCCLKGMKAADIVKGRQGIENRKDVYRIVHEIRKELREEGLQETIYVTKTGDYVAGIPPKDQTKPKLVQLLKYLQKCNDKIEYEIDLEDPELIKIQLKGSIEIDRTKDAEDVVASIILEKQYGIYNRSVK